MKAGWVRSTIGNFCEVIAGQSPEGKYYNADGTGLPFYQGKKDFGEKFIKAPTTWTSETTKTARKNDILMSVRAPVGPINFATEDICIGRGLAAIRSNGELDGDFLFYQLLYLQPEIAGREGAVFASINKAEIAALPILVGPIHEQQRIVAILDEGFAGIASASAAAEQNRQNARALFESHLQSIFTQRGDGWREKTISELVAEGVIAKPQDGNHGETHPVKADFVENGVPFVMASDLHDGIVDTQGCRFISEQQARSLRIGFSLDQDVLLSHKGTIGRVAILHTDREYVMLTPQVTYYRVLDNKQLFNRYLYFYFQSPKFQSKVWQIAGGGSTRAYIGITRQLDLDVVLPPAEVQIQLAEELEQLANETQRLTSLYQQKLAALDALKQSLLHQVFSGQL